MNGYRVPGTYFFSDHIVSDKPPRERKKGAYERLKRLRKIRRASSQRNR